MRSSTRAAAAAALLAVSEMSETKEGKREVSRTNRVSKPKQKFSQSRKRKLSPPPKQDRKRTSRSQPTRQAAAAARTPTPTTSKSRRDSTPGKPQKAKEVKTTPVKDHHPKESKKEIVDVKPGKEEKKPSSSPVKPSVSDIIDEVPSPKVEVLPIPPSSSTSASSSPSPPAGSMMEEAIQLFSKKHGLSQTVMKAAITAEQQETLPSINDPDAIDAFFRRNRRRSFKDLIPALDNTVAQTTPVNTTSNSTDTEGGDSLTSNANGSIPDDHPMKPFVDQSDKEMSVKEALARGFRNYKVRLPKARRSDDPLSSLTSAADFATLLANFNNIDDNNEYKFGEATSLNDLLASALLGLNNLERTSTSPQPTSTDEKDTAEGRDQRDISESRSDASTTPGFSDIEHYKLPPFWRCKVDISKGYKGGYYVMGIKYIPVTALIHNGSFIVSLDKPIRCQLDENICELTLNQLLLLNGIVITDPNRVDDLTEIFGSSLLVLHHAIVEVLLKTSSTLSGLNMNRLNKEHDQLPIKLTRSAPPMTCYKLNVFLSYLGTVHGGNEILDDLSFPSESSTSAERTQTVERELSPKEKLFVVTNFDAGISKDVICMRYNISSSTVDQIIANREEIQRMAALVLMEEAKSEESRQFNTASIAEAIVEQQRIMKDGIKKKNRVRRTSFVGLNILMWRFFKDCADNGIPLNGKMLKEHAMIIARQLGLDNFKGSEGWLDAFKRRHKIDLKQMTGSPANYDEDIDETRMDADDLDDQLGDDREQSTELSMANINASGSGDGRLWNWPNMDGGPALLSGMTAALLNCVEKAALPMAVASISNTKPLDLANLFRSQLETNIGSSHNGVLPSTSSEQSDHHDCSINNVNNNPMPYVQTQNHVDENGIIAAIIKSSALPIPNNDICSAMNTIRSYIVTQDPTAMPLFLQLQEKLSTTEKSTR